MVSYKKYMYSVNVYILCMHVCMYSLLPPGGGMVVYYYILIFLPGSRASRLVGT